MKVQSVRAAAAHMTASAVEATVNNAFKRYMYVCIAAETGRPVGIKIGKGINTW